MQKVVALCRRRGIIFPGSEIYGGLSNSYDYGPLGVELKNNIKRAWWRKFVTSRSDIYGLDGSVILSPKVWEASGHVESFTDPLVECLECHKRFRLDQNDAFEARNDYFEIRNWPIPCPSGQPHDLKIKDAKIGTLIVPKRFNGMFRTFIGATEDKSSLAYLRPETAQAIFINFRNILDSYHPHIPFGIAQIGKAFRNEITAGNFIHRLLEFEQMEIEYFISPKVNWKKIFDEWQNAMIEFLIEMGADKNKIHSREHSKEERSHYSKKTVDIEFDFPFGTKEVYGLAYRGDYDLTKHSEKSGRDLKYTDSKSGESYIPHVIEPSFGVERTLLAVLLSSYAEDDGRVLLKLPYNMAPFKVAVFPLVSNKENIVKKAREIYMNLMKLVPTSWDERGNIGKRYFAQDEIGTPYCVTVDYQTLEDDTVTIRDRDTKKQERIKIVDAVEKFSSNL
jgi:glycyl-tRNA synthetase